MNESFIHWWLTESKKSQIQFSGTKQLLSPVSQLSHGRSKWSHTLSHRPWLLGSQGHLRRWWQRCQRCHDNAVMDICPFDVILKVCHLWFLSNRTIVWGHGKMWCEDCLCSSWLQGHSDLKTDFLWSLLAQGIVNVTWSSYLEVP